MQQQKNANWEQMVNAFSILRTMTNLFAENKLVRILNTMIMNLVILKHILLGSVFMMGYNVLQKSHAKNILMKNLVIMEAPMENAYLVLMFVVLC